MLIVLFNCNDLGAKEIHFEQQLCIESLGAAITLGYTCVYVGICIVCA